MYIYRITVLKRKAHHAPIRVFPSVPSISLSQLLLAHGPPPFSSSTPVSSPHHPTIPRPSPATASSLQLARVIPDSPQPNRPSLGSPVLGAWNGQAQSIDCPSTLLNTVPKKPLSHISYANALLRPPHRLGQPRRLSQPLPRRLSRLERFPSILPLSISPASPRLRRPRLCSPSSDPTPISPRAGFQQSHSHRNPNAPRKTSCSKESRPRVFAGR